jgi:hypothetical protein|eukprot:COSAG06_NODE_14232_length_1176_cov_3.538533_1_plen_52_part_00
MARTKRQTPAAYFNAKDAAKEAGHTLAAAAAAGAAAATAEDIQSEKSTMYT